MEAWKKRLVKSIANLGDGNCLTERPKVFCWLLGRYFPRLVVPVGSPFPHLWPSTETPKPTSTILQDYWSQMDAVFMVPKGYSWFNGQILVGNTHVHSSGSASDVLPRRYTNMGLNRTSSQFISVFQLIELKIAGPSGFEASSGVPSPSVRSLGSNWTVANPKR